MSDVLNPTDNLLGGLENFVAAVKMENGTELDVNIDVVIEAAAEDEVTTADVAEEIEAADGEATKVEMIMRQLDEVDHAATYVAQNGLNRATLSFLNRTGALNKLTGRTFPAAESYDPIGSVDSEDSIACIEAFGETAKKVWEFIKSVFKNLAAILASVYQKIMAKVTSYEKTVARIKTSMKGAEYDEEKLKTKEFDIVSSRTYAAFNTSKAEFGKKLEAKIPSMTEVLAALDKDDTSKLEKAEAAISESMKKFSDRDTKTTKGKLPALWSSSERDKLVPQLEDLVMKLKETNGYIDKLKNDATHAEKKAAAAATMSPGDEGKKKVQNYRAAARMANNNMRVATGGVRVLQKEIRILTTAALAWISCKK